MIASGFSQAGARVLLTSRDDKACAQAAAELGHNCRYVASNVSTREGCQALADHVASVFDSKLDVLVHNAGTSWGEPMERDSKTNWGWDKVLDLNVKGIFYLTNACLPLLQHPGCTADNPSRIITIGSVAGVMPQEAPTHAYDVSKAAVHHLTRKLSADLAPKHITVNCVAPGYVPTRMSRGLKTWGAPDVDDADQMAAASNVVPLGRAGAPEDMAGACMYFASRAGSWCTGVVLPVDGGCLGARVIPLSSNL